MHFKKDHIIRLHNRITNFANENLREIEKKSIDVSNEYDSFYLGLIIRQSNINNDLRLLFINKSNGYMTSENVLYRCLVDDFIHIIYIVNQENIEETITNFNASALNTNFNKIKELAELNEKKLGGNYPFYPTYSLLEKTKEYMKASPNRRKYFLDIDNFKFKSFKSTGNLIRDLGDQAYSHQLRRAYFIWRKLSDFVHYSNFTYETEQQINPEQDTTYTEFSEIISYSYFTVLNCLKHFEIKYGLKLVDSEKLFEYYAGSIH